MVEYDARGFADGVEISESWEIGWDAACRLEDGSRREPLEPDIIRMESGSDYRHEGIGDFFDLVFVRDGEEFRFRMNLFTAGCLAQYFEDACLVDFMRGGDIPEEYFDLRRTYRKDMTMSLRDMMVINRVAPEEREAFAEAWMAEDATD